eukprot:11211633-Lingulodinium_polyedra.AAC.1
MAPKMVFPHKEFDLKINHRGRLDFCLFWPAFAPRPFWRCNVAFAGDVRALRRCAAGVVNPKPNTLMYI